MYTSSAMKTYNGSSKRTLTHIPSSIEKKKTQARTLPTSGDIQDVDFRFPTIEARAIDQDLPELKFKQHIIVHTFVNAPENLHQRSIRHTL
jgi:hypothetical protein